MCAAKAQLNVTADNFMETLFPSLEPWLRSFLVLDALVVDMGDGCANFGLWSAMKPRLSAYSSFAPTR